MGKKITILAITCAILAFSQPAYAEKVYRIGYLQGSPNMDSGNVRAFRRGLRELGYVEGRNIIIEWRHTNRRRDIFAEKVKELVRLGLDCIVTVGDAATRAAKEGTNTIPIVMANTDGDPVRYGLIASYARPGGNVTGVTGFASGLSGKRLELLKETVPGLSRVVALVKGRGALGAAAHIPQIAKAARVLGVAFRPLEIQVNEDVNKAFRDAAKWKADALLVVTVGGMRGHRKRIIDLAAQMRLPVMYTRKSWVHRGGLMSYSANNLEVRRRAAAFVDKILKGAKPADLPVERPTRFDFVINLKTAKALRITIPPAILLSATEVIE